MAGFEQVAFGSDGDFIGNPEPRCPCLLLLDTSHSMQGRAISELNRGIVTLKDQLATDALAMKRVEIAVVTFGPVNIESSFQTPDYWQPTALSTTGDTPMGAAIEQPCRPTWGIRTSSTRCAIRSCRRTGSRTSGADGG